MNILPTHTCFDDAMDLLVQAVKANPGSEYSDEILLVHAVCFTPDWKEYSHAWVETCGRIVWSVGIIDGRRTQYGVNLDEYYASMRVKETTKYTPRQAWEENRKHVTFGPWLDRYKDLCADRKAVRT